MDPDPETVATLRTENERLREENARLSRALEDLRARMIEPEEVLRAIRQGEIDALVVEEQGGDQIYSLQTFDSVYRAMVEQYFPYGVWMATGEGTPIYVTNTFMDLLGADLVSGGERGLFSFLPAEVREAVEREWARSLETGLPCSVEYPIVLPDGSRKDIWTQGLRVQSHDGQHVWVGVNVDVTERNRSRDELRRQADALREADRRKDEFLALLGHELRNPLATMDSCLHILLMPEVDDESAEQARQMMAKQMHHLTRMVDDLLDVNRITRGIIQLRREKVDLVAAARRAVASVAPLIASRVHDLRVSLPEDPLCLEADPTRLEQVLVNLLNNAAKYTNPGGRIGLSIRREGDEAVILVEDNGLGIPSDLLPVIFDLFVQGATSLDRSQGGLGIGLTLVRRLVEMHGGRIEAASPGQGQGSRFLVRLPALTEPARPEAPRGFDMQASARRRILVVDDSEDLCKSLKLLLELRGHEVLVAHDGSCALATAREQGPEVVLLDIGLPGMSGYDVARRMSDHFGDRKPLVVAMSGYGQEEDKRRAHEAGFDLHITKPVDPRRLLSLIAGAGVGARA